MQLILELLKKIFVALQGVYTKAETDTALAEIDLQRVIDAQASRNVVMNNILTIAKAPVDNVHPLLLMGDFSSRIGSVNTTTGQISGFLNETMPQSDGTFVVTNRVSGGPLELSEDGTAPNHAVSLGQLTEEAQAREQADEKHDAELNAMKARAMATRGDVCLMYVDIPEDDGTIEHWKTDATDYHRYYDLGIQGYNGEFAIDWGDGVIDSHNYTAITYVRHQYLIAGRYYILVSGTIKRIYTQADNSISPILNSAMAAGIGVVMLRSDSATSMTGAFPGFNGIDVSIVVPNCTSLANTFLGAKIKNIRLTHGGATTAYCFARNANVDSVTIHPPIQTYTLTAYCAARRITMGVLAESITDYFLYWSREFLEEVYLYAPNLKRLTGNAINYGFQNRPNFRVMGYGLPSLENGNGLFENTNLDKASVLRILNALPDRTGVEPEQDGDGVITFTSNVATAAINNIDAEIQAAIDAARNKNWTVEI